MILPLILCGVLGYLLGNIQTGLIVGRLTGNIDLREHGSGSSGATNALRTLGRQSAAFTFLGDFAKGMLSTGIGMLIAGWQGGMLGAFFVVIGHIWPVFYGFHGGKGVAASIGALAMLTPLYTLIILAVGIVVILLTKMVSLGSMCAAAVYLLIAVVSTIASQDWFFLVFAILMASLVIFAHRANIGRIRKGTESKISATMFRKKK